MTERITLVEIDLDRCSLTYGQAPCTASIPATGDIKCFNCFATCQDQANYAQETVTARYSTASSRLSTDFEAIPNIEKVSIRPAKLELGESIGVRASINIDFRDERFPDTGPEGDRYLSDRDYDPYERGTYWGKFRARWPYVKGSSIRLIRGNSDQSIAQMEIRHFLIEKVAGPNSNGGFTIQCKDALQLADGKQSQAPIISNGSILNARTPTNTTLTLDPVGIGSEYPLSGVAQLGGEEIVTFTRSGDILFITRGQYNTEAVSHDAGARVQVCLEYSQKTVTYILNDLLLNYANVPSEFIPLSDWTTEDNNYIARNYSSLIAEPTEVKKLINELLEQTASTIWWDDVSKLLKFRVLRSVATDAALYDDNQIVGGSFSAKDQPEKRVSQVWTYFGQINPLEKLDETKNYSSTLAVVSTESETNFNNVPSIKRIFSRWIPDTGADAADRLNRLILSRYSTPPRLISYNVQRGLNITPELGGGYRAKSWTIQDETGLSVELPIQTIQVKSSDTGFSVLAEEVLYNQTVAPEDPTIKNVSIVVNENNINLREKFFDVFSIINTGDTINFTIEEGVIIGGASTGSASLVYGAWDEDITINLTNNGTVAGRGGRGGSGARINSDGSLTTGFNGSNGDDAIDLPVTGLPIPTVFNITNNGLIGGGGGGGGGGGAAKAVMSTGLASPSQALYGVSGSGGGGAPFVNFGGSFGVIENPSQFITSGINTVNGAKNGLSGQNSSELVTGVGGIRTGFSFFSDFNPTPDPDSYVRNGEGGDGGYFGSNGINGGDGITLNPISGSVTSNGGNGGAAGDAILKRGKTVTITNNGQIHGAIVP